VSLGMIVALLPAFNEEKRIATVIDKAQEFVDRVIVCDDGSTDATYEKAVDCGAEIISHERNLGYGAALRSLFTHAKIFPAQAFVTIDSDGQHDSSYIPKLTAPILRGEADVVIGSRFLRGRDATPAHRRIAIKLITGLCDVVTGNEFTDLQSGFRAYNSRAITLTCPTRPGMGASTEIIMKATKSRLRLKEIGVPIYYNGDRTSPVESARQFIDVINSIVFPFLS
jgi:glycosyltransferase involved in cell wall biosynthesis